VFIVEGDRLVTAPLDGRILPGVTRARLIDVVGHRVDEEPFGLDRLLASDGVLVTGALRGAQPAVSCDARVLPPPWTRPISSTGR
jgi:para-aminobenzoate synthetase/4-amino-4-deoxychorismate lyase